MAGSGPAGALDPAATFDGPVAFDATPLVTFRTGIGASVHEMWSALAGRPGGPQMIPYALGLRTRAGAGALPPSTRVVRMSTRALLAAWSLTEHPRLARTLRGAAVVHCTNYVVPPTTIPTLVTVNDVSFIADPASADWVLGRFPAVLRRAVQRGAHIHVTTNHVAAEVDDHFGPGLRAEGRVHVVPFGIPTLAGPGGLPEPLMERLGARPYILAVGRHDTRKNLPRLVEAFGELAGRHGELLLVLAGPEGRDTAAVRAAIDRLPAAIAVRVVVAGPLSPPALRTLLDRALLLAYPSLYEGFGFPPLEAMAAGVPVLVGRGGAVGEVAGLAAESVDVTDVAALAGGLDRLVSDPDRRRALIGAGRGHVAGFSWAAMADGLTALYARLATSR